MTETLIQVSQLSYRYSENGRARAHPALSELSFECHAGERIGLVGPNGAGKTTLFLCLTGILEGYTGEINIAGHSPADRKSVRAVRNAAGIVFQATDDQLFSPTVLDDVAFGPRNQGLSREESIRLAREALRYVDFPRALEEIHPHELSGGERRRVALAGVLAMKPRVLLLDEPGSDLDPRGKRRLVDLLISIGCAQIVAAHDLELVRKICPRSLILDQGRLVADGVTDELFSNRELMESHGLEVPPSLR